MKILITGGLGFIGSNFVRFMLDAHPDYTLVNLDKMTYAGNPDNLKDIEHSPNYSFVRGDIADQAGIESLFSQHRFDAVINFAAETHVDRSIGNPGDFITTDVYGTYVLLEAAKKYGVSRFIQISTDEVYGEAVGNPSGENDALMPKSPYAASKAGADRLAFSYYTTYDLPVIITRCSNNYGPYQYPEKMIPLFVTNALENKSLPVYGNGTNTRDWIFVTDHCRAVDKILHTDGLEGEVFNVGSGHEYSILDISDIILRVLDKPNDLIQFVPDRLGHVQRHAVDCNKINDRLGWQPLTQFETALEETIHWYRENQPWWRKIKSGEYLKYYKNQYTTIA